VVAAGIAIVAAGGLGFMSSSGPSPEPETAPALSRVPYCDIARRYRVPPELLAGVILAENALNRDWKDTAQDVIFRFLVDHRDELWWSRWREQAMQLADLSENEHLAFNKWPLEVVTSGVVFSIGPAQITPRTAIQACAQTETSNEHCSSGTRALIQALLDDTASTELAAMILDYERRGQLKVTSEDVSCDIAAWSTLYNYGGGSYRKAAPGGTRLVNAFGNWVHIRASSIHQSLACDSSDYHPACKAPPGLFHKTLPSASD
jgi:hypothetical protein